MAQTQPSIETRIEKAAEEILLVAARNGILLAQVYSNGNAVNSNEADELWSRTLQLARLRCSDIVGGQTQLDEPQFGSNLPQ